MNQDLFKGPSDYWRVAETIKNLYMSDGSMATLLDFERVIDELDIYAFQNWILGELIEGPEISRYSVACTFMWPLELMPDPRGAKRLLPFDCKVSYKKTKMKVPTKVQDYDDFIGGTKKPKLIDKDIWLVEIVMPKDLISDIREGSIELEDQNIDLEDLDLAYEQDLDQASAYDDTDEELADEIETQDEDNAEQPFA
jgi:hypothetical protein